MASKHSRARHFRPGFGGAARGHIALNFVTLRFRSPMPRKVRSHSRLIKFDSDWTEAGIYRWVRYSYLKPGDISFKYFSLAANNHGLWNEVGKSMSLHVRPHSWKTWWSLTSLGLVSIAGGAALAGYISHRGLRRELERLKHRRDIEQDRARIA